MAISAYHKGEATIDSGVIRPVVGILQRARCQECIMCRVKSNGAKFFPVPHERLFRHDLVYR